MCLPEPPAAFRQVWGAQAGLSAVPSPSTPPPLHSAPTHTPPLLLTHSLAHTSPLISAPGLEQLRNLRHLDVAYNLLERHRELAPLWLLTELRKVRTGELASCPPPTSPHAELVSPLPHRRRPKAHLSHLLCAQLCLEGNPLWFHPEHRVATAWYLSPRARDAAAGVSVCPCLLCLPFPARPPSPLHALAFPHIPW